MSQSIIELTTLVPYPQYSILYYHQIDGGNYFSLRNKVTLAFYFTFEKIENISINNIVYLTPQELVNAYNATFQGQPIIQNNQDVSLIITELTTLIPSPEYSILYYHQIDGKDYFSLKNKITLAFYFTFEKLNSISINNIVYQTAQGLIDAFILQFNAGEYVPENNGPDVVESIIELTDLIPSPQYSILYHHQIENKDYFSLKSQNNRFSYFTFEKLNVISINNIVYQTAEELINAFNAEFGNENALGLVVTLPEFNRIVTNTGFTSDASSITFNADSSWLIKAVKYTNPISVTKTILPTTAGYKRIDVFVATTQNTFNTISGVETLGSPVKPSIPINTIELTFTIVGDAGIETIEPIDLSEYSTKNYVDGKDIILSQRITVLENSVFSKIQFTANGIDATFDLVTIAKAKAVFWNGAILNDADWSQINNILTLTFTPANGEIIKPI
jgi:hypothetical protein